MVTSKDKANHFLKSPLYKSGVVSGVSMLPRLPSFIYIIFMYLLAVFRHMSKGKGFWPPTASQE